MGISNFTGNHNNNQTPPNIPPGGLFFGNPAAGQGDIDPLEYLIDYNQKFKNAGQTLFRGQVIKQTMAVLIGKTKPNAMLIGPSGVGKTKIVEDLAYRLANNNPSIPDQLKGFTIYELPLSNIVANSGIVGQLEEKVKAIVTFIEDKQNKAILFIDEIHQLADTHSTIYQKIAQILKPALARGDMRVIGATTLQEAKDLKNDPALDRRFSPLIVDELTQDQTIEILKHVKTSYLTHYHNAIVLNDQVLTTIMQYADRFCPANSHRPDNALTLLDRVIGDAIVTRKHQEAKLANDPAQLQILRSAYPIPITDKRIEQTAKKLASGNSMPESFDKQKLINALSRIQGQDEAIADIIKQLTKHSLRLDDTNNKPLSMLFVGPSGVGKTEVTKIIAEQITGTKPIVLNMTEYHSPASINRIIGAPAGYVGSDSHAELPFDTLESNPYQVILLDELDKCDRAVQTLFYQAFDEGTIKTNSGKEINFSKTIIIATTNAGHMSTAKPLGFTTEQKKTSYECDIKELGKYFNLALLNRIKHRYTFNPIDKPTYGEILKDLYKTKSQQIQKTHPRIQLTDTIPDDILKRMIEDTYVEEFGARPAYDTIMEYIEDQAL